MEHINEFKPTTYNDQFMDAGKDFGDKLSHMSTDFSDPENWTKEMITLYDFIINGCSTAAQEGHHSAVFKVMDSVPHYMEVANYIADNNNVRFVSETVSGFSAFNGLPDGRYFRFIWS